MDRRTFLKLIGAGMVVALAETVEFPTGTALAAETNSGIGERNLPNESETPINPEEMLTHLIEEAKTYIAKEVPMLSDHASSLNFKNRTNLEIGLQIPSDIGNHQSEDPTKVNKTGFELGSHTYSPYPDNPEQEGGKGAVYKRIKQDLRKICDIFSSDEQRAQAMMKYLNALGEQILERQRRYSDKMSDFPGKRTRVGLSAELVDYYYGLVDFLNQLGINDSKIGAAILRTHPQVAQIIAMQQAGFSVDVQMNGLPTWFVEPDGDKDWPIYNPIKEETIPALTEFINTLALATEYQQAESSNPKEKIRLSTTNEPTNIHIGDQASVYARRLLQAQLKLIENGSQIILIGPSVKTDYEGKLDTTFRIIDQFIATIESFIKEHKINEPSVINQLLSCLPTLTVYGSDAKSFMTKADALVVGIGNRIQGLLTRLKDANLLTEEQLKEIKVEINFAEMGIEWPYYQDEGGLNRGANEMIKIVKSLKNKIQTWKKSYPWLRFTSIFFIHNPGGPDYHGKNFDDIARKTTSEIPVSRSFIPMIGVAPDTNLETNRRRFTDLCNAVR